MNHQIEHHSHIRPARIEWCQSIAFDEQWRVHERNRRADRAIEPLDVPDLQHDAGGRWQATADSSASSSVTVNGFSTNTCLPRRNAADATAWCDVVGTTMETASTASSSNSSVGKVGNAERLRHLSRTRRIFIHEAHELVAGQVPQHAGHGARRVHRHRRRQFAALMAARSSAPRRIRCSAADAALTGFDERQEFRDFGNRFASRRACDQWPASG